MVRILIQVRGEKKATFENISKIKRSRKYLSRKLGDAEKTLEERLKKIQSQNYEIDSPEQMVDSPPHPSMANSETRVFILRDFKIFMSTLVLPKNFPNLTFEFENCENELQLFRIIRFC